MGTVSDDVVGFTKCVAERNFDCRNVRVYRSGVGAWPHFRHIESSFLAYRRVGRATAADGKHAGRNGCARAIFAAYVRAAGKLAGAPNEFCGPMAKQHRMLVITITCLYSAIVPQSWQVFHFDNLEIGVMALALSVIIAGCLVTIVRRLRRTARALR